MLRNRTGNIALLVFLAAGILAGTWYLLTMRFSGGDVYPPYSSLRADPLGCKALYDTFDNLDRFKVRRHYTGIGDLSPQRSEAVFILGLKAWDLGGIEADLSRLAAGGARVVVALNEHYPGNREAENGKHSDSLGREDPQKAGSGKQEDGGEYTRGTWNLSLKNSNARADSSGKYQAVVIPSKADLPSLISITSPTYFDASRSRWQVIYTLENKPVVMQRNIGLGAVVLLSDSYPVSNEALRWELYPRLLSWLLSDAGGAVFVESHLGVVETPGVMTLLKKYRLTALLGCVLVIALLAVWKNAVPLVPPSETDARDDTYLISEKDQFNGLVSLLKRNIGPGRAVQLCIDELRKGPGSRAGQPDGLDGVMVTERGNDPVAAYNRITRKISERT